MFSPTHTQVCVSPGTIPDTSIISIISLKAVALLPVCIGSGIVCVVAIAEFDGFLQHPGFVHEESKGILNVTWEVELAANYLVWVEDAE